MSGGAPTEGFRGREDVAVDVEHRLPCRGTGVEDEAELTVGLLRGDLLGEVHEASEELGVGTGELRDVGVVLPGHHEHVHGRLRVDVPEGDGVLVLSHDVGRQVARDDPAEEAVAHGR